MNASHLKRSALPTLTAAVLGNAFIGRESLRWFKNLRSPAMQLPLSGSIAVGSAYYLSIGTVLYRSTARLDRRSYSLALAVLVGNELWNVTLFGRRSTLGGFVGILGFTVPLSLLQLSVSGDRISTAALGPYTAWVFGYDIPWSYLLWRLNPTPTRGVSVQETVRRD
jgi:tryptophan-rich sensory protein